MINLTIDGENLDNLELFSELLKKDEGTIINMALKEFFINQHKKVLEKDIENENAMTNLDYDEFWDGVDIDT